MELLTPSDDVMNDPSCSSRSPPAFFADMTPCSYGVKLSASPAKLPSSAAARAATRSAWSPNRKVSFGASDKTTPYLLSVPTFPDSALPTSTAAPSRSTESLPSFRLASARSWVRGMKLGYLLSSKLKRGQLSLGRNGLLISEPGNFLPFGSQLFERLYLLICRAGTVANGGCQPGFGVFLLAGQAGQASQRGTDCDRCARRLNQLSASGF